jgi:hypothetical protein
MKRSCVALMMWVGLSLLGCGGSEFEEAPLSEADERTVSQFATCTATCSGGSSVSCAGTTCSSTNNHGVTCDGVFKACGASCGGLPSCNLYSNQKCTTPNAIKSCCNPSTGRPDELLCSGSMSTGYRWLYF